MLDSANHLVESISFAILLCQSYLRECVSMRGLLHYSREQYSSGGSTAALNCFLTQKSASRMTRGRKRYQTPRKSTGENDHSQSGQGEEIATPPA